MLPRLRQLGQRRPFLFPAAPVPDHFKRSAVLILFWQEVVETRGIKYVNPVVEWPGGRVFGLTADLLLEALAWATGGTPGSRARSTV